MDPLEYDRLMGTLEDISRLLEAGDLGDLAEAKRKTEEAKTWLSVSRFTHVPE
jgi:hypothetical protein